METKRSWNNWNPVLQSGITIFHVRIEINNFSWESGWAWKHKYVRRHLDQKRLASEAGWEKDASKGCDSATLNRLHKCQVNRGCNQARALCRQQGRLVNLQRTGSSANRYWGIFWEGINSSTCSYDDLSANKNLFIQFVSYVPESYQCNQKGKKLWYESNGDQVLIT